LYKTRSVDGMSLKDNDLRILVLAGELPKFPGKGSAVRLLHLSRLLSRDFKLSMICLAKMPEVEPELPYYADVSYIPFDGARDSFIGATVANTPFADYVMKLRQSALPTPVATQFLTIPYLQKLENAIAVMERDAKDDFHGFLVETDVLAGAIRAVPTHGFAALDCHQVSSIILSEESRSVLPSEGKALLKEAKRYETYEAKNWRKFDSVCVTSEIDRDKILSRGAIDPRNITIIPNGVDVDYFKFSSEGRQKNNLIFVGDMKTRSNVEAVKSLINYVMPELVRSDPSYRLTVVGRNLPPEIETMPMRGLRITFVKELDDIRKYYNEAFAFVGPYKSGGGARLSMLEAMSAGLPVVTTSYGLHGLSVTEGEHLLVAKDAPSFVTAIGALAKYPDLYRKIQLEARKYVEENHVWDRVAAKMAELFIRMSAYYVK